MLLNKVKGSMRPEPISFEINKRSGFSQPALEKCADYGIQPLSLIENDPINKKFFIGTRWTVDDTKWREILISLYFTDPAQKIDNFNSDQLKINNKLVIHGITNYLADHEHEYTGLGWIVDLAAVFDEPRLVEISPGIERLCNAISFKVERVMTQLEYRVGVASDGFFNWNSREATFAPGSKFVTEPVPTDLSLWKPRSDKTWPKSGFIEFHLETTSKFERIDGALDLECLWLLDSYSHNSCAK